MRIIKFESLIFMNEFKLKSIIGNKKYSQESQIRALTILECKRNNWKAIKENKPESKLFSINHN